MDPRKNADPARWGLVANGDVREHFPEREPALTFALSEARFGRWRHAAAVVADSWGDWDRRSHVVGAVADVGAHDDGWLNRWRAAHPDDPHLAVVDAEAWVRLAWAVRGTAPDWETADEHLRAFQRVLRRAEAAVEHAVEVAPDDPTPWWSFTEIACGLSFDHDRFGRIWAGLTARAPAHRAGHDRALGYWSERWCGSHDLATAFAERAANTSHLLAALPLHAALESAADDPVAWRTPLVHAALDAVLARDHVDDRASRTDRGYAVLALVDNHRYAEAVDQFRLLGPHADGEPWRHFPDPKEAFLDLRAEACLRAGRPTRTS
ncbi:DUF4034 domain-containing protein [Umezawaea endophytica]|uniref:DUF4034 domain-containing protein n=1 Tax=Umezawaea endophytica TaxID=1654476 RepID=A0A9X3AHN9_9PSEU|nr:DUF4034 domain-containing protein [Umezawaea endophytica]MCS7481772.1 DUF4034 domain-containing protein [Umezawaea endophytica]